MATFNLAWTAPVLTNSTTANQRVEYRQKNSGPFINNTSNIAPTNDLSNTATAAVISNLTDNVIYEFRVLSVCPNGVTNVNMDGIKEGINFACVPPTANTFTDTSITVVVASLPPDITKVTFNRGTGNVFATPSNGIASYTFPNLTPGISYTITAELSAFVNNGERTSSFGNCSVTRITAPATTCTAPNNLVVSNALA